jgi:hypothetical protein
MIRLAFKLALAAAAVVAVWRWVPIDGRTLAERWEGAGSFSAFARRGLDELARAGEPPPPRARRQVARERPVERHTEADRRALDRLLADELERR